MIRTRSGPKIPVEFFERFTLTGDERYIQLCCKLCKAYLTDIEWWGEVNLSKLLFEAAEHECPKPVSPAEDSFMTNAEIQETRDVAVATGKFQVREKPQVSKGNPYEKIEENGGSLTMTVTPENVL